MCSRDSVERAIERNACGSNIKRLTTLVAEGIKLNAANEGDSSRERQLQPSTSLYRPQLIYGDDSFPVKTLHSTSKRLYSGIYYDRCYQRSSKSSAIAQYNPQPLVCMNSTKAIPQHQNHGPPKNSTPPQTTTGVSSTLQQHAAFTLPLLEFYNVQWLRRMTTKNSNVSARPFKNKGIFTLPQTLKASRSALHLVVLLNFAAFMVLGPGAVGVAANKDAARLFEDLLADYNKLVRPVDNNTATLVVKFKLKLSQLLDVHEKQQIMTTNVWLQHSWTDHKLIWNPSEYGGVDVLYVPSEMIWLPDIVLYNNADGNYQVTIMTKAKLTYNGTVEWTPPAIYKSMCQIDVEWFPFDMQNCSWTYGGLEVDLKHKDEHLQREEQEKVLGIDGEYMEPIWVVDEGIDLSDYYPSVEWDILMIPGKRHEKRYPCCESPFIDLTYEIYLRRKTLFYTVNLMIPCVGISFLTALVFYLPSDGGEKISLCISILISLTVFFLLLVEIIPSTSLVIPLIGKYLLFTMVLVTLSVIVTVITLNVHYRAPATHKMSAWMRKLFIEVLPYYLLMRRPTPLRGHILSPKCSTASLQGMPPMIRKTSLQKRRESFSNRVREQNMSILGEPTSDYLTPRTGGAADISGGGTSCGGDGSQRGSFQREQTPIRSAVDSVTYISDHFRKEEEDQQVIEDWKYVSVVMDRIFLILFTGVCFIGTARIIFRAPSIYDSTPALA